MFFVGHGLLSIIRHDIFEHLCLRKEVAIVVVSEEPEPRGLMVKVVVYTEVVFATLLYTLAFLSFFLQFLNHVLSSSEDIGFTLLFGLHHVI